MDDYLAPPRIEPDCTLYIGATRGITPADVYLPIPLLEPVSATFSAARSFAAALRSGGRTDWQLPDIAAFELINRVYYENGIFSVPPTYLQWVAPSRQGLAGRITDLFAKQRTVVMGVAAGNIMQREAPSTHEYYFNICRIVPRAHPG